MTEKTYIDEIYEFAKFRVTVDRKEDLFRSIICEEEDFPVVKNILDIVGFEFIIVEKFNKKGYISIRFKINPKGIQKITIWKKLTD